MGPGPAACRRQRRTAKGLHEQSLVFNHYAASGGIRRNCTIITTRNRGRRRPPIPIPVPIPISVPVRLENSLQSVLPQPFDPIRNDVLLVTPNQLTALS